MNDSLRPRRRAVGSPPIRLLGWLATAALIGAAVVGPAAPLALGASDHANGASQLHANNGNGGGHGSAGGNGANGVGSTANTGTGAGNGGNTDAGLGATGGPGAIWTTSAPCSSPAPQDQNLYAIGQTVYIRGEGFAPTAQYSWTITGQPGGASTRPGIVVAQGSAGSDANGAFCVAAYTIQPGDGGEFTVDLAGAKKNDNYRVDAPAPTAGSGGGGGSVGGGTTGGGTDGGGTTGGGTGGTTGGGSGTGGSGTGGSGTGGQTGDTGGTTTGGGTTGGGTTTGGTTSGGGQTGTGGTQSNTGGGPTGDVAGEHQAQPVAVPQPAPAGGVLGATGRPKHTLPPTDTLEPTGTSAPDLTAWRLLLVGLAAFLASLLTMTPGRAASRNSGR